MGDGGVPCCHICEEAFDLVDRDPVFLSCGHTFCRNCMRQLALKNPEKPDLDCPECRTPTPIPRPFDPACFKRNFGLAEVLPGAHGKKHPRDQDTLHDLTARAQEKVEKLQRARDEAAQTLDAIDHQVDAWGATLRRLADDYSPHLKEKARAKAPEVEQSIRAADAHLQELREALALPPAKVLCPDEAIKQLQVRPSRVASFDAYVVNGLVDWLKEHAPSPMRRKAPPNRRNLPEEGPMTVISKFDLSTPSILQALLDAPVEVKGLEVNLKPPTADLLNDLNRVDVKRLLPREEEKKVERKDEEPPLDFASPELTVALRLFSAIPPGLRPRCFILFPIFWLAFICLQIMRHFAAQPLTRSGILAWCRRLVTDGAPAEGSCPADQLADLLGHPAFADDHKALRHILRAIRAAAPKSKLIKNVAAAPLTQLLGHCPPDLLGTLVSAIRYTMHTWEAKMMPKWQEIRRWIESPAARESPALLGAYLGILGTQLIVVTWELPECRECAQLLAHLASSPGFLVNYSAHTPFFRALRQLSVVWEKRMGTRAPEISAAFRVFAFLIVQLLRDDGAMAIPQISAALLDTALILGRSDPVFKGTLREAGLTGMYDRLLEHPTITADAAQGKMLGQLIELFSYL
ncbi:hypothetical protein PAPYR_10761 [Paratrimastix pyriformis]|uniref:RING-type domain-containing protein n=1 Tax=Paratrimastix pyriformis TaxID=342808 RepID=A0ABQ8U573_9EUKA|nr:hypothetical protein PAPYR_10761 [Paratrimastix pyriformis]